MKETTSRQKKLIFKGLATDCDLKYSAVSYWENDYGYRGKDFYFCCSDSNLRKCEENERKRCRLLKCEKEIISYPDIKQDPQCAFTRIIEYQVSRCKHSVLKVGCGSSVCPKLNKEL